MFAVKWHETAFNWSAVSLLMVGPSATPSARRPSRRATPLQVLMIHPHVLLMLLLRILLLHLISTPPIGVGADLLRKISLLLLLLKTLLLRLLLLLLFWMAVKGPLFRLLCFRLIFNLREILILLLMVLIFTRFLLCFFLFIILFFSVTFRAFSEFFGSSKFLLNSSFFY